MSAKRTHDTAMRESQDDPSTKATASPYMPIFEVCKARLDDFQLRREKVIKASRDITAASKKVISGLQRVRTVGQPIPGHVMKSNAEHWGTIRAQYMAVGEHLQGMNAWRYQWNITGGNQEFMEALSFQHYLETQRLITYEEAKQKLNEQTDREKGYVLMLPFEDYVLGIFDMTGELMRSAITSMATTGALPGGQLRRTQQSGQDAMDLDTTSSTESRDALVDLRQLRSALESLDYGSDFHFRRDVEKKMTVMQASTEKVEKAMYELIIRGREKPKGWMPDLRDEAAVPRGEVVH